MGKKSNKEPYANKITQELKSYDVCTLLNKWRVYIVEIIKNVQDILGVIIFENMLFDIGIQ